MQPAENRRRFDAETDRKLVPTGGGRHPIWSRDGRELFYESPESHVMAAAYIAKADSFAADKPPLVQHADPRTPYGQRIHAARPWNTLGVREMCTGPALDGSPFQAISAQRAILSIARLSGRIRQARPFVNTSDYPRVITVHAPAAGTSTSRRQTVNLNPVATVPLGGSRSAASHKRTFGKTSESIFQGRVFTYPSRQRKGRSPEEAILSVCWPYLIKVCSCREKGGGDRRRSCLRTCGAGAAISVSAKRLMCWCPHSPPGGSAPEVQPPQE